MQESAVTNVYLSVNTKVVAACYPFFLTSVLNAILLTKRQMKYY